MYDAHSNGGVSKASVINLKALAHISHQPCEPSLASLIHKNSISPEIHTATVRLSNVAVSEKVRGLDAKYFM